jgi:hypothetical protein
MKKNYLKIISSTFIVGAFLLFSFGSGESKKTDEPSNDSRNTYQEQIKEEPEKKECYRCKGSGIITCTMCGGTGINNMGMDCGCVTYVANCRAMGKEPTRTALQWTCEHCKGTGYEK